MGNPFHGENSQQLKTGPGGPKEKKAGSKAGLNMKLKSYPGLPGKSGPKRDTLGVRHPPQHAQDKGLG